MSGSVSVTANASVKATTLTIQQVWRVHGRGNTFEKVIAEQAETVPDAEPGRCSEFTFRFSAPEQPVSYHGHLINVDHYVRARLDIPWGIDARAEADYLVAPGAGSADAYVREKGTEAPPQQASGCGKAIGWILLPVLVPLLLIVIVMLLPILLVVGAVILLRRYLAERRLGQVTTEIGGARLETGKGYAGLGAGILKRLRPAGDVLHVVSPNETIRVSLRFTPSADVGLDGARLEIAGTEAATSGSGTDATTYRHTVCSEKVPLLEARSLQRGMPVEVTVPVRLPETDAFSLDTESNKITWTATFRIDIRGWPDWVQSNELLLVPAKVESR